MFYYTPKNMDKNEIIKINAITPLNKHGCILLEFNILVVVFAKDIALFHCNLKGDRFRTADSHIPTFPY
jgi:hypothetical protein